MTDSDDLRRLVTGDDEGMVSRIVYAEGPETGFQSIDDGDGSEMIVYDDYPNTPVQTFFYDETGALQVVHDDPGTGGSPGQGADQVPPGEAFRPVYMEAHSEGAGDPAAPGGLGGSGAPAGPGDPGGEPFVQVRNGPGGPLAMIQERGEGGGGDPGVSPGQGGEGLLTEPEPARLGMELRSPVGESVQGKAQEPGSDGDGPGQGQGQGPGPGPDGQGGPGGPGQSPTPGQGSNPAPRMGEWSSPDSGKGGPAPGSGGFTIDLEMLSMAITSVSAERNNIATDLAGIKNKANGLASFWNSPAYASYDEVGRWFDRVSTDLLNLLEELIVRLETSHTNYSRAEGANVQNMTPR